MRARPSKLLLTIASVAVLVGACVGKVHVAPAASAPTPRIAVVTPMATALNGPGVPAGQATPDLDGLPARIEQATADAAAQGAAISAAVLDRATGQLISNNPSHSIATASVAKLFIADDLLLHESDGAAELSPEERAELDVMLRSSDDNAAEKFWNAGGGDAIITRVATRYGLAATTPGSDGRWWNTISTAADLARYYDMLLDGAGGLPRERASIIMTDLAHSTAAGIDGYPQRFGIPEGLYAEPVAVKQGWMCCIGADWMHLSTGVVGSDHRYVVVVESLQPSDDATARQTITQAVKTMFPGGRI
ncbi:hypothetical protein ACAG26_23685 [Mycobacterium sp. pUA109]|uniref:hypothetical protein n=1 Tax=Mycobacterium sp. pUA109 TaxID=3238982 RepID=UPI00351B7115